MRQLRQAEIAKKRGGSESLDWTQSSGPVGITRMIRSRDLRSTGLRRKQASESATKLRAHRLQYQSAPAAGATADAKDLQRQKSAALKRPGETKTSTRRRRRGRVSSNLFGNRDALVTQQRPSHQSHAGGPRTTRLRSSCIGTRRPTTLYANSPTAKQGSPLVARLG